MQVGDLHLGEIDAKNEILKGKRLEDEIFFKSYTLPYNINLEQLKKGVLFFITGYKGTGKTALLRFLENSLKQDNTQTDFTLFKSRISEQERQQMSVAAGFSLIGTEEQNKNSIEQDFKDIWKWYLLHKIYSCAKNLCVINDRKTDAVFSMSEKKEKRSILDYLPKFKKGTAKVEIDAEIIKASLKGEFEGRENNKRNEINFSDLCKIAEEKIRNIEYKNKKIFLFIDELEVFYEKSDQFDRDRRLYKRSSVFNNTIK